MCLAHRGWAQQHSGEGWPTARAGGGQGWLCGGAETCRRWPQGHGQDTPASGDLSSTNCTVPRPAWPSPATGSAGRITASSVLTGLSVTTAAPDKRRRRLHFTETRSEVAAVAHRAQSPQASPTSCSMATSTAPRGAWLCPRCERPPCDLRALHAHLATSLAPWPPRRPAVGAASTVLGNPSRRVLRGATAAYA